QSSQFIWNSPKELSFGTYILTCHVEDNGKRRSLSAFNIQIAQRITASLKVSNTAVTQQTVAQSPTTVPLNQTIKPIPQGVQKENKTTKKLAITVKDQTGNPFPNVLVTLYSSPKTAINNHTGIGEFDHVEPGSHTINFAMSGLSASQLIAVSDDPSIQQVSIAATLTNENPATKTAQ